MRLTARHILAGRILLTASVLIVAGGAPALYAAASGAERVFLVLGLAMGAPIWAWFWLHAVDSANGLERAASVALLTIALANVTYLAGPGRDALLFAALAAGAAFAFPRAAAIVLAIAVLDGILQSARGASGLGALSIAFNDLIVGAAAITGRLLLVTNRELLRARDDQAALAAAGERLRLARDLHDILGQDLTLAVLKNELLGASLPSEAGAARTLQSDLAEALRKSLDDLRTAVTGLRATSLTVELDTARAALQQAGIEVEMPKSLPQLSPQADSALGWVVREGVTNVLRHSSARHCWIAIGEDAGGVVVEIRDDGGGAVAPPGSGLSGLSERITALGGSLQIEGIDGFRLRAAVPPS